MSSSARSTQATHSFVGLLLAGVFRSFARVATDLYVHGVDDVEEVLHHCHALEGRVHRRHPVHILRTQAERPIKRPRQPRQQLLVCVRWRWSPPKLFIYLVKTHFNQVWGCMFKRQQLTHTLTHTRTQQDKGGSVCLRGRKGNNSHRCERTHTYTYTGQAAGSKSH